MTDVKLTNAQRQLLLLAAEENTDRGLGIVPYGPQWTVFYSLGKRGLMEFRGRRSVTITQDGLVALARSK